MATSTTTTPNATPPSAIFIAAHPVSGRTHRFGRRGGEAWHSTVDAGPSNQSLEYRQKAVQVPLNPSSESLDSPDLPHSSRFTSFHQITIASTSGFLGFFRKSGGAGF